ncbi:Toll/interleukin-1 receptor domain-containing protein [Tanacetum coccineum]
MAILNEIQQEAAKTYDVFLSFRGKDTRFSFTDYLYQALVNENITTFLDEQEVETGEELKPELAKAIKSSRASIIVLSKNYASSTWCLDELVLILEQRKASNHIVLPVFYHVEPTHVRKQESSFGDALFEHKQRMEAEEDEEKKIEAARKLESWTKALKEVADLKGKDVNGRYLAFPEGSFAMLEETTISLLGSWSRMGLVVFAVAGKVLMGVRFAVSRSFEESALRFVVVDPRVWEIGWGLDGLSQKTGYEAMRGREDGIRWSKFNLWLFRETVFIEEIVKEISTRLDLHTQSKIPHLIGMESFIDTISSWLKGGSSDTTEILTIWGMAGIGKTSLAKSIYWLHQHEFDRSSFVENIETICGPQSSTLLHLQNQLLRDMLNKSISEEHNVDVCTSKIQKALLNKQVFVVLDGVDNHEQVDVLVGRKGFHPGSKIIITTKDASLTEKCALFRVEFPPKHTNLALEGLSGTDSLRLLCWHAFGGYAPKEGYEVEATRASKYCEGHPLALKVLGSSLINEDVATWSHTFRMLETTEFRTRVHKVLRVSFDSLPSENCKELFKHIACFFVGENREVTEEILEDCGIHTSYGIQKLIDRCLLTIGVQNQLRMHQLLQDLGRELVRQESPHKPWKRSRVWNHEESLSILQEDKGTTRIQGLVLDMKMLEKGRGSSSVIDHIFQSHDLIMNFGAGLPVDRVPEFSSSRFKNIELRTNVLNKMEKLNLLRLNHVKLNGSYKNFPKGLRGLCLHGFQSKYIPSDLPMEKLVALDMSYSDLKHLWRKPTHLGSLKYLNLSYCKLVTVGGFKGLPALKTLKLKGCKSLTSVCDTIGGCGSLALLDMRYCHKLKNLPVSISKLKSVRVLSLDGCIGARKFENKMMHMKLLKVVNEDSVCTNSHVRFSAITRFILNNQKSLSLSLPPSLVTLSLQSNNLSNESFPMDFSSMSMLKNLYLDNNPIDSMPGCLRSLSRLENLSVADCLMLKSVLRPPSTIKRLYTDRCRSLVNITFHHEMSAPPLVYYEESVSLTEVQGIIKIQALAQVDDEILCSLGWTDLQYVKNYKVPIWDSYIWSRAQKLPVHMYYEFGIFSTCFPGKEVPEWLAHRSSGSSIWLTMPSSSMNKRIEGINICFVHTFSGTGVVSWLRIKVWNITKNRTWIYYGYIFAVRETDENLIWLSHWMFGNNEIEAGDEVSVTIVEEEEDRGITVIECAMSPVYNDSDKDDNSLSYYKSWKHIIGGDLSAFELTSGDYFLSHDRFIHPAKDFKELFRHRTTQKLVGYIPQYKVKETDDAEENVNETPYPSGGYMPKELRKWHLKDQDLSQTSGPLPALKATSPFQKSRDCVPHATIPSDTSLGVVRRSHSPGVRNSVSA